MITLRDEDTPLFPGRHLRLKTTGATETEAWENAMLVERYNRSEHGTEKGHPRYYGTHIQLRVREIITEAFAALRRQQMASHPIPIRPEVCKNCGRLHTEIPSTAGFSDTGFYWNCACGTTKHAIFILKYKAPLAPEMSEAAFVGGCI